MIRHDSIQGQMFKKFKDSEGFVANFGISSSRIYFKIGPEEFLKNYPALKISSLSSHYFRNKIKKL